MKKNIIIIIALFLTILLADLPMGLSPEWNGENMYHRNQYELLAESMLKGHVYIEYAPIYSTKLSQMENPYDTEEREKLSIPYKWDHAYYKGRYYVYFGVVPAVVTFLPFRLLTGKSLKTYHATQIYVGLFIIGIYFLFYYLKKKTKVKINDAEYILASVSVSLASVWYAIDYPALYTTAITSGMMFSIWSIYFYIKAYLEKDKKLKNILIGAFLGALIFGCRPTLGFTNLLFFPALISLIKSEKKENKVIVAILTFIPFVFIGLLLMLYNYTRFDSVFEFGQKYQLTAVDQTNMLSENLNLKHFTTELKKFLFYTEPFGDTFPYIKYFGLFFNYPMLIIPIITIFSKKFRNVLKKHKLLSIYLLIIISIIFSTVFIVLMCPYVIVRYQMDVVYLLGILLYINYLFLKKNSWINLLFLIIFIDLFMKTFLLYWIPDMYNYPSHLYKRVRH